MASIKLILPIEILSLNKLLRIHWTARRKLQTSYMDEIMVAINMMKQTHKSMLTQGKRECLIISHRKRELDPDNLVGGAKLLVDCLVDFRLLRGDSPKDVVLIVEQKKSSTPQTIVVLTDIKEEK